MAWFWWAQLLVAGVPTLYLAVLTLGMLRSGTAIPLAKDTPRTRFIIVVPAHDEALLIGDTVQRLLTLDYPRELFDVIVIANACSDDTAVRAHNTGARVIEYAVPGKGQALHHTFGLLADEPWDAALVIDADSSLDKNALTIIDSYIAQGAQAIQLRYAVRNASDALRTRAAALTLASYNGLRPLGRDAIGWSASIFGNGFCLTKATLQRVPYLAHSIVEDLEYHLLLMRAGVRVRFTDKVAVWAQMPVTRQQARVQRVRWERGRLTLIRQYGPAIIADLLHGRPGVWAMASDLFMLPVAWIFIGLLLVMCAAPHFPAVLAAILLLTLISHYLLAAKRYKLLGHLPRVIGYVPLYIIEKIWLVLRSLLRERHLGWQRTGRHKEK